MAKKILYLGNNKWCYTPNCSDHATLRSAKSKLVECLKSGNLSEAQNVIEELKTTPEGTAVLYQTQTQLLAKKLKRRPNIGLDVDNTSGGFTEGLRAFMVAKSPVKIPKEKWKEKFPDLSTYDYHGGDKGWFTDRKDFEKYFFQAEEDGIYLKMPMYENVSKTLTELRNYGFNIKVITARRAIFNNHTTEWFKMHDAGKFKIFNPGHAKHTIKDIDVYLEDSPTVIETLISAEKNVLIMSQDYNEKDFGEGNYDRTKGWQENIVDKIFNLITKAPKKDEK